MAPIRRTSYARAATQFGDGTGKIVRRASLGAIAVCLCGLIYTHTVSAYLAAVKPEWALAIRQSNSKALLRLAEPGIATIAKTFASGDIDSNSLGAIRPSLIAALYSDPLNARAFEMLGILASAKGDKDAADASMRAALNLSCRSPAALTWLAENASAKNDIVTSASYIDVLLRIRPEAAPLVVPTLYRIAASPGGLQALVATLSRAPLWRSSLFRGLNNDPRHGEFSLKLLLGLRATQNPPSTKEVDAYVRSLVIAHEFQPAYYAWLQLLPAEKAKAAGFLYDGDFRFAPTTNPFDWTVRLGDGVLAEITPSGDKSPNGNLSLVLTGGPVGFRPVEQLVVLPRGRYKFSGRIRGDLSGSRGLKWKVMCIAPSQKTVGETAMLGGTFPKPTEFNAFLDVPEQCSAQSVHLVIDARSATETTDAGSVSFSNLRIVRERL